MIIACIECQFGWFMLCGAAVLAGRQHLLRLAARIKTKLRR